MSNRTIAHAAADYRQDHVIGEDPNGPVLQRWWMGFADPVTAQLVETALEHNTDLIAAAARIPKGPVPAAPLAQAERASVPGFAIAIGAASRRL